MKNKTTDAISICNSFPNMQAVTTQYTASDLGMKDAANLKDVAALETFAEGIVQIQEMGTLDAKKLEWANYSTAMTSLKNALQQAIKSLDGHIRSQLKRSADAKAKEDAAAEKKAVQETKEELARRAKRQKVASTNAGPTLDPVFNIEISAFAKFTETTGKVVDKSVNLDLPFKHKDCDAIGEWSVATAVAKQMSTWAGKYKKVDGFSEELKANQVLEAKKGKEETEALWDTILLTQFADQVCDIKSVAPTFQNTSWQCGYDKVYSGIGMCPNSAGMMRILLYGAMDVYALKPILAIKAFQTNLKYYTGFFETLQ